MSKCVMLTPVFGACPNKAEGTTSVQITSGGLTVIMRVGICATHKPTLFRVGSNVRRRGDTAIMTVLDESPNV